MNPLTNFVLDRRRLLESVGASPERPGRHLEAILRHLGYRLVAGGSRRFYSGNVFVDFTTRTVYIQKSVVEFPLLRRLALGKALGHIRLHAHRDPEDYIDWWQQEAHLYSQVFLKVGA